MFYAIILSVKWFKILNNNNNNNNNNINICQCSTVTFFDARQWASEHNKSLAHKGKPLVQNKARKKCTYKG